MDCSEEFLETPAIAYELLFRSASAIPMWHYLAGALSLFVVFLYNFLEFHFFEDLLAGFRGGPVLLTYNPSSEIYHGVVSKCRTLHGRWVRAVNEYLGALLSSSHMHTQKKAEDVNAIMQSSIDRGPYLNVAEGIVAAMGEEQMNSAIKETSEHENCDQTNQIGSVLKDRKESDFCASENVGDSKDNSSFVKRCFYQLSRQNKNSIWLLAYIAVISSWPVVGAALGFLFKRKIKKTLPAKVLK